MTALSRVALYGLVFTWGCKEATGPAKSASDSTSTSAPVAVPGGLRFSSISAGGSHSCGLTGDGTAYCWGHNNAGELGIGAIDTLDHVVPQAVTGGLKFAVISAGYSHTCAVTTGGAAYCWGDNGSGQLGVNSSVLLDPPLASTVPIPVPGALVFTAISAGRTHTCAVTAAGDAQCWGSNQTGQLGRVPWDWQNIQPPGPVAGGLAFVSLSARDVHTCGVTIDGAAYCWGMNASGSLGNGSTASSSTPAAVVGGLAFTAVSAGLYHTCALTPGGAAYCWGDNEVGALGNGTRDGDWHETPGPVSGGLNLVAVSAGGSHTCGLTSNGAAYCWGYNQWGQLGDGTSGDSRKPVPVSGGLTFAALSAGVAQTCGITTAGAAYCWGIARPWGQP